MLRQEMKRQGMSSRDLARRLASRPESVPAVLRKVKRWRSGETQSVTPESAEALDKALGTINVFTQFAVRPERYGTRRALEAALIEIDELRKRIKRLEEAQ